MSGNGRKPVLISRFLHSRMYICFNTRVKILNSISRYEPRSTCTDMDILA